MMQLYRLTEAYNAIWDQIERESVEGEVEQSLVAMLDGINESIEIKFENTVKLMRSVELVQQLMAEESRHWAAKAAKMQRRVESLKEYLKEALEVIGQHKADAGIFKLRIVPNSQVTVEVVNEHEIPAMYDLPAVRRVDKRAIAEAIAAGVEIAGVDVYRGTHLRIDR